MNLSRIAGIGILLFTVLSVIHYSMIDLKILVPEDMNVIFQFIKDNEGVFRIGIVMDLFLFIIGIGTFTAIYLILKPEHPFLSLFAFSLILVQLAISIGVEVTSFQLLAMVDMGNGELNDHSDFSMLLKWRSHGYLVATVLFSMAMVLISVMVKRLSYIHSWIGWLGLIAFSGLLVPIILNILIPHNIFAWLVTIASMFALVFQLVLGTILFRNK
jgi:hypothetical protein